MLSTALNSWFESLADRLRRSRGLDRPEAVTVLTNRHIYILPTVTGTAFAAVMVVMLMGSMNFKLSLGYALVFLLSGMAFASMLHTYRNLAGLRIAGGRADPVFAGDAARFQVHLEAPKGLDRRAVVLTPAADSAQPDSAAIADIDADLPPVTVEMTLRARRRGLLRLGRVRVETRYPLGLFRSWSWAEMDARCVIYPHPAARDTPFPSAPDGDGSGVGASQGDGQEDFTGLRRWRPGDNLGQVAWKMLARERGMLTKEFAGEARASLWFDFDAITHADTELRLSILCRWILDAHAGGEHYGLRLPGTTVAPASDETHLRRCLEALALYEVSGVTP
ncbi:MAG: DUF58 domain-containing protein [Gammaproteobacteria bacterium]